MIDMYELLSDQVLFPSKEKEFEVEHVIFDTVFN